MAITFDDILKITNGKGIFSVTINNTGNSTSKLIVVAELVPAPEGYESVSVVEEVSVEAHSSVTVSLPVPYVIPPKKRRDIADYEGMGPELPTDSHVEVSVSMGEWGHPCQSYEAKYIPETRFIELPEVINFNINYDQQPSFSLLAALQNPMVSPKDKPGIFFGVSK